MRTSLNPAIFPRELGFAAWDIATQQEFNVAPAIYTPQVLRVMKSGMEEAEVLVAPIEDINHTRKKNRQGQPARCHERKPRSHQSGL